jgi:hypothetical protein
MNKLDTNKDPLHQYMNPEMGEKAPEGFSSNVMTRIQMESAPRRSVTFITRRNIVPSVSVVLTLILIISAFLLPVNNNPGILQASEFLNGLTLTFPSIDFPGGFFKGIPSWVPYLFIGFLLLSIFDRALYGIFHRRD